MLLKNFYKGQAAAVLWDNTNSTKGVPDVKGWNGNTFIAYGNANARWTNFAYNAGYIRTSVGSNSQGVVFGTGDTPPTPDDYKLSGDVISTISAAKNITGKTDDTGVEMVAQYTITNTGSADITIREIGMYSIFYHTTSSNVTNTLIERTVLDEPVTIPAGGVGVVTYTIRMNYPTA